MNPFDLRGPQFLVFYLGLMIVTLGLLALARRVFESGPVPKLPYVDPYLVAYLRGGAPEAVRVATLALVDRGLLVASGEELRAEAQAASQVRRPLERGIISALRSPRSAYLLIKDREVIDGTRHLERELCELGLVPDASDRMRRRLLGLCALLLLWIVAWQKITLAIERGKSNIGLLILLALASLFMIAALVRRPRTTRGDRLLGDLRVLFSGLRERSASLRGGGASQELALLSAVFGLSALQGEQLARSRELFPKASSSSGSSCGSSCSSSDSSSSGCSSCGGGGGCGGCGS